MSEPGRPLRILLSEGSSTSGREALTILGLSGHIVHVCDPSRWCLTRFSRFVRKVHRCPTLRDDPAGYLAFVETLLSAQHFDVLLPIHEQGFLFARAGGRLRRHAALALPGFENYRIAHGKAGFSRLLSELGMPQPATAIVHSERELRQAIHFPAVLKTSIGTASRGVWFVHDEAELARAVLDLDEHDAFADEVLVQEMVAGTTEKAQSVFCRGQLLGFHAYRQITAGVGGGEAIKQSVSRPEIEAYFAKIGARLGWHGALSIDYVVGDDDGLPRLIDCNPRLVEPMSAYLAGVDLVGLLLRVSMGETPATVPHGREGVRSHLAMQALLGCAARGGTRRDLLRECWHLWKGRGAYAGSREELTPVRLDWMGAIPLLMTFALAFAAPRSAAAIAQRGFGASLLNAKGVRRVASEGFAGV